MAENLRGNHFSSLCILLPSPREGQEVLSFSMRMRRRKNVTA